MQRRLRAALRPVAKGEERREEPPEGVQLLEEGVLLGVVGPVVHKVADHVGVAPVVQSNYALKAMEGDNAAPHNVSEMGRGIIWAQNSMPQNSMKIKLEIPGVL